MSLTQDTINLIKSKKHNLFKSDGNIMKETPHQCFFAILESTKHQTCFNMELQLSIKLKQKI